MNRTLEDLVEHDDMLEIARHNVGCAITQLVFKNITSIDSGYYKRLRDALALIEECKKNNYFLVEASKGNFWENDK